MAALSNVVLPVVLLAAAVSNAALEIGAALTAPTIAVKELRVNDYRASDGVEYWPVAHGHTEDDLLWAWWSSYVVTDRGEPGTERICGNGNLGKYTELKAPLRWSLDYITGDEGCADRLAPGHYYLFVKLRPEDGRDSAMAAAKFEVKE